MCINDDSIDEENKELFDHAIDISNRISKLYEELTDAEIKYGRDSKEYKNKSVAIDLSCEYEDGIIDKIFEDSSVVSLFCSYLKKRPCDRLDKRINSDLDLASFLFYVMMNEEYDNIMEKMTSEREGLMKKLSSSFPLPDGDLKKYYELMENGVRLPPRDIYLRSKYDKIGINSMSSVVFGLLLCKKIILIIEEYLEREEDPQVRAFLIAKKNSILCENKLVEAWYFGFSNNLDCLTIDIDSFAASFINCDEEYYTHIKNEYFDQIAYAEANFMIHGEETSKEEKISQELIFLAAILCMDTKHLDMNYQAFRSTFCDKEGKTFEEKVNEVDDLYGKASMLAKKFIQRYSCGEV